MSREVDSMPPDLRGQLVDFLAQLDKVDRELAQIADIRDAIAHVLGYPVYTRPLVTSRPSETPREAAFAELHATLDGLRLACAAGLPALNRVWEENVGEPWAVHFGELEAAMSGFASTKGN